LPTLFFRYLKTDHFHPYLDRPVEIFANPGTVWLRPKG
jgi:hypothetical protein